MHKLCIPHSKNSRATIEYEPVFLFKCSTRTW